MKNSTKNVLFSYLYRDAANYKLTRNVIFANPDNLSLSEIEETIKANLKDEDFFMPYVWDLEKLTFDDFDPELDHEWCEFCGIENTDQESNIEITINSLLKKIELVKMEHGNSFIF